MLFCYNCQVFTYYALLKQKNRQEKNYFSKAQGGHTLVGDIVHISPESPPPPTLPPPSRNCGQLCSHPNQICQILDNF